MELKQAIIVRADLGMGKGKLAAQSAHASVEAMGKADNETVAAWKAQGMKKVVLKVQSEKELLELFMRAKRELPSALIKDAGLTQIESGTATAVGIGPAIENKIDKLTKELKLL
jgi:PTH2 family peptidyl-tRNA hydrolase